MGVAADRVFGDAERGAEHARLGRQLIRVRPAIQREHEEAVDAEFRADRDAGCRSSARSYPGREHPRRDEQPGAAFASEACGHDLVQLSGGKPQRFGDAQRGFERQRIVQFGHGLPKFDEVVSRPAADADSSRANFEHAGPGTLAHGAVRAPAQGEQHGVGGNGGVPDERRFLARIEEAQPHIVVRRGGGEHEGHLGVGEFARDGHQGGIALPVRIQDHGRRIAGESSASECVNLKDSQARSPRPMHEFCTHRRGRLHFRQPWGGPSGPEMREVEHPAPANPLNLTRLVPA